MTADAIAHALRRLESSDGLRALENQLAEQSAFNLFDAVGIARQELRHSDFLAFLLRPNEAYGLGDTFLHWFLETALKQSDAPPLALATLHQWDLSDARVGRESQNIDLFITSATNGMAVVVENKIDTGEHSDQLTRYRDLALAHGYGGPNKALLCIYLTPRGDAPSHADYLPLSYQSICSHLETLCKTGAFDHAASPDVVTVVRHYTRMLRNQSIVSDPEITRLCRELYAQHKPAFERIFAERNNTVEQKMTTSTIEAIIKNTSGIFSVETKTYNKVKYTLFVPQLWANEKGLIHRGGGPPRYIYLQVEIHPGGEKFVSGMVRPEATPTQQRLVSLINHHKELNFMPNPDGGSFKCFYRYPLKADEDFYPQWQEWVATEGPRFAALISPGSFPAI